MDSNSSDKQTVRVTILSRPYTLRATGSTHEVEQLAASVDELMLSIAGRAPTADSTTIAVLACMHLADRLRGLETELGQFRLRVDRKSEEYAGLLERLIASASEKA